MNIRYFKLKDNSIYAIYYKNKKTIYYNHNFKCGTKIIIIK